ncbi:MAG: HutD family protein, partial [Ilumatobacteraceae bacterium]|nr:HutD family protein [Ilumatobacteraceae bacterium]
MPWANGLGSTSVVARRPDDDGWVWRISLADVVSDGPFSRLPDVD